MSMQKKNIVPYIQVTIRDKSKKNMRFLRHYYCIKHFKHHLKGIHM